MKIAPIMDALHQCSTIETKLIHTGQHYDVDMNDRFFRELNIPKPDLDLEVGSSSHAVQTANVMLGFEPVLDAEKPDAVLVVGDVNSTIACALVAVKKGVQVIHVEAGLRSFDRTMPEEINRILTDQISDVLFTTEQAAAEQLRKENIAADKIHFAGNVMIDTLFRQLPRATDPAEIWVKYQVDKNVFNEFAVLTMHRPSNVDDAGRLENLLYTLRQISDSIAIIFPVHPRTRAKIEQFGLQSLLDGDGLLVVPPLGYLDMLGLNAKATMVLTDSGGIQEETTALGVPCITLRDNTERPITVTEGTNTVVGADPTRIRDTVSEILSTGGKQGRVPVMWDGKAAQRIAGELQKIYP